MGDVLYDIDGIMFSDLMDDLYHLLIIPKHDGSESAHNDTDSCSIGRCLGHDHKQIASMVSKHQVIADHTIEILD